MRARCEECNRVFTVRPPKGGDGSADVFPRHAVTYASPPKPRCFGSRQVVRDFEYVRNSKD